MKYKNLVARRQTEIPGLVSSLLASAKAGDREAQQALHLLSDASMRSLLELTRTWNVGTVLHLLALLRETLDELEEQCRRHPEFYQPWARISDAWPCLMPRRNPEQEELADFLSKSLQLGEAYPLNLCSKAADKKALCSQVALYIYHALENWAWSPTSGDDPGVIRASLQPFSRTSAPHWWKAAQPLFLQLSLEQQPAFKQHFQKPGDTPGAVRDKIKKLVKQSFLRLASKDS